MSGTIRVNEECFGCNKVIQYGFPLIITTSFATDIYVLCESCADYMDNNFDRILLEHAVKEPS